MAEKYIYATIPVKPKTKKKIDARGRKGETYDEIINRLLKQTEGGN